MKFFFPATKVFALGIAWERSLLMAKSGTPHRIPEDAEGRVGGHFVGFQSPSSNQTNWSPYQLHPLTSTTYSGNYRTNQVHRLWTIHWWYANAHHDLGHVSNMPKEYKCMCSRSEAFIPDATSQIEGLIVITSKEWIEGAEFNSWKLLCTIGDATPQENFYDPKELVSFSRKHPKWIDGQMVETNRATCQL